MQILDTWVVDFKGEKGWDGGIESVVELFGCEPGVSASNTACGDEEFFCLE